MTPEERRRQNRCPICSGPMKEVEGGQRHCRNSLCLQNHKGKKCPQCGETEGIAVGAFENGRYRFTCSSCEKCWSE